MQLIAFQGVERGKPRFDGVFNGFTNLRDALRGAIQEQVHPFMKHAHPGRWDAYHAVSAMIVWYPGGLLGAGPFGRVKKLVPRSASSKAPTLERLVCNSTMRTGLEM